METLSYPACSHARCDAPARTVSFGYTQGRLTSVAGYASSLSYHANGLVNQVVHTNGITDTQTTDSSGIPRPGSISFSGFAGIVGSYAYDGAANVKQIGSHRYSYDLESRITFSNLGTLGTQGFSYDRYGNRTRIVKDGVAYDYPAGPSTNRLTGNGAVYDDAGNQLRISDSTIAPQNYAYDPLNMMVSVQSSSYAANYLYTADDERFVELDTSGSGIVAKYTLRGLGGEVLRRFEHVWGTGWFWEKDYVHRGGAMLATETPERVQHFHLDHLGTPRLITNGAGAEISRHTYFPFGEEANSPVQNPERRKFTGHERDSNGVGTSDDVDYMHARYSSPTLGRFLSADPRGGTPYDPQSWNRFGYGLNNPIRFVDPNGEAPVDIASITGRSARTEDFAGTVAAEFSRNTARSLLNTAKGFANAITSLGLLSTGKHPSVHSEFGTLMFPAETKADLREQVLGPTAVGLMLSGIGTTRGMPANAAFAQRTFSERFSARGKFSGSTVSDVAGALRSGNLTPADVPVDFIIREGNALILNTRSAQALTQAGIPRSQWTTVNRTGQAAFEARLTQQLERNGLTSSGISIVLPPGGAN